MNTVLQIKRFLERTINLMIFDEEPAKRRAEDEAFTPDRERTVSPVPRACAYFAASADKGSVRIIP